MLWCSNDIYTQILCHLYSSFPNWFYLIKLQVISTKEDQEKIIYWFYLIKQFFLDSSSSIYNLLSLLSYFILRLLFTLCKYFYLIFLSVLDLCLNFFGIHEIKFFTHLTVYTNSRFIFYIMRITSYLFVIVYNNFRSIFYIMRITSYLFVIFSFLFVIFCYFMFSDYCFEIINMIMYSLCWFFISFG